MAAQIDEIIKYKIIAGEKTKVKILMIILRLLNRTGAPAKYVNTNSKNAIYKLRAI